MNGCRGCGQDFASVEGFDRHRVGVHEYTYSEGARMDPVRDDGRRCLDPDEMLTVGLRRNQRGLWTTKAEGSRERLPIAQRARVKPARGVPAATGR